MDKRILVFRIMLTVIAAAFQAAPRILGDAFFFAVLLGGVPVYIAARHNCIFGVIVYLSASTLSVYININEALFFICTNGIIGLSLGIIKNRFKNIYLVPVPSTFLVIVMVFTVNYLFGISILDNSSLKAPMEQAFMLFPLLYVYSLIYLKMAMFTDNLIHKYIALD